MAKKSTLYTVLVVALVMLLTQSFAGSLIA